MDDETRAVFVRFCSEPIARRLEPWQLQVLSQWPWGETPTLGTYRSMAATLMEIQRQKNGTT